MSFAVGSLVRFVGRFESMGAMKDPREVTAVITIDGVERTYGVSSGGVTRRGEGVYTVDVLIDRLGEMTVRFNGDFGFGESTFDVERTSPRVDDSGDVAPSSRSSVTPSRAVEDEFEEAAALEAAAIVRLDRIAELVEAGIDAEGRSDAFIESAYEELVKKRPASPQERHAQTQRTAWRRS